VLVGSCPRIIHTKGILHKGNYIFTKERVLSKKKKNWTYEKSPAKHKGKLNPLLAFIFFPCVCVQVGSCQKIMHTKGILHRKLHIHKRKGFE